MICSVESAVSATSGSTILTEFVFRNSMEARSFTTRFLDQTIPVYYIKDKAQAAEAVSRMMEQSTLIGIDTETEALPMWHGRPEAALSPHLSKIRLIQTYNNRAACVFDMKYINCPEIFIPFLEEKRFVAHNALFDLQFFMQMGVKSMNIGCTYILAKLMFHASRPSDEGLRGSLEGLCKGLFSYDILKENQASDWSVPELTFEQVEYAALDAIAVMRLAEKLSPVISGYKMERYYKLCKDAQHPIAHMQLNGIGLDEAGHRRLMDEWLGKLNTARKAVVKVLGGDSVSPHTIAAFLETHLDKQILALWPHTEMGKLQTDVHAFADFQGVSPIIKPFAEYQKLKTLTSDFGSKLIQQINPATGRIHASYRLNGARTGRLSCSNPNLQQLPRELVVRSNFVARAGNVFLCADYSQIELRVAAELSRDSAMLEAYRKGIDLHALTASKVSGKPINQITKADRQMAKAVNFGFLFGLGSKKFSHYAKKSYGAEVTPDEAAQAIKTFRETYRGYHAWQKLQAEQASISLQTRTPCGKLRRLDPENTYGTAMNTPVQGGACECMLYALIQLQNYADDCNFKIINCVHDEIILETTDTTHNIETAKGALKSAMRIGFERVFPDGINKDLCEVGVGFNWGSAKN